MSDLNENRMNQEVNKKIHELRDLLRETAPDNTTKVEIVISGYITSINYTERTPEDLKTAGCSMRNIRGEFIK